MNLSAEEMNLSADGRGTRFEILFSRLTDMKLPAAKFEFVNPQMPIMVWGAISETVFFSVG